MPDSVLGSPSRSKSRLLLRARLVLPISRPPIPNGAVVVEGRRIAAVGSWRNLAGESRGKVMDLGESILLPGLVNSHCHLDYTNMAGLLPPAKRFTDWLKLIVSVKAHWELSDYRESWREGARMLLRNGTTMVADIEAFPQLLPDCWEATPLRILSLVEMIGLSGQREPQAILNEALERIARLRHGRCRVGLSPHAPYSTVPELLRLSARAARRHHWLLSTHVAESAEEFDMFTRAKGEMFEWLKQSGRNMSDCGSVSPVQHMNRYGALGKNLLAVHANYLKRGDADLLAKRRVHVIHCPRSHRYFRHDPFPLKRLARAGVNLCLGTDSLATVFKKRREAVELNMFEEMRQLSSEPDAPAPKAILRMCTLNGALALGFSGQMGELKEGALADLIALPFQGKTARGYEAVMEHSGPVTANMIGGGWVLRPA
jgi:cytosine/adenosine deaminase-related metal-dependent hydrolase